MFKFELIADFGKAPTTAQANQFVVRLSNGTPVLLGTVTLAGDDGEAVSLLTYKDERFTQELQRLGFESKPVKILNWKDS